MSNTTRRTQRIDSYALVAVPPADAREATPNIVETGSDVDRLHLLRAHVRGITKHALFVVPFTSYIDVEITEGEQQ